MCTYCCSECVKHFQLIQPSRTKSLLPFLLEEEREEDGETERGRGRDRGREGVGEREKQGERERNRTINKQKVLREPTFTTQNKKQSLPNP